MHESYWVSAHIFYHEPLDPLLTGLVGPLVDELAAAGLVEDYFFLRYWDGGNHLRLRLLPVAGGEAGKDAVRRLVEKRATAFLRDRPAADLLAQGKYEYSEYAAWAAQLENLTEYLPRAYPNNTVAFIRYQREYERYTHAAIEAVERHFVESSRIALRLLRAGLSAGRRDTAAFSILLLSWLCAGIGGEHLARTVAAFGRRRDAEQRFARQAGTLGQLALRMRARAAQGAHGTGGGALDAWLHSVTRLRDTLGSTPLMPSIIDTCAHLAGNRLGVTLPEEGYLRYLAARTLIEDPAPEGQRHAMA
jgi:thiopeptide-type bacteriocin biosynthesis protein